MMLPLAFETSSSSKLDLPPPPDLLRRFVACPHRVTWHMAGVMFDVETNREDLLKLFPRCRRSKTDVGIRLRIIVDPDIPAGDDRERFILHSGEVCWGYINGLL